MKTSAPTLSKIALIATTSFLLSATVAHADYYLQRNQSQGWNWNTINAGTGWFPSLKGGSALSAIDSGGTYHTNGFQVRTKEANRNDPVDHFKGGKLILDGSDGSQTSGSLALKAQDPAQAEIDALTSISGTLYTGSGGTPQNLKIGAFEQSGTTHFIANASGRGYNLTIAKLTGEGVIAFEEQHAADHSTCFNITITDASAYKGAFEFSGGTLTLEHDLAAPAASLAFKDGVSVDLNGKTITVASLTINGTSLPAQKYSAVDLKTHGIAVTGAGAVVVRPAP